MSGEPATILIPSRGRPEQLTRLLESLRATGHLDGPAHSVVVDNNPPGSAASSTIEGLTADYGVTRVVGGGPKSRALNAAARRARGDYLVFLDDDTTVDTTTWLGDLVGAFEPDIGYIAGDVRARAVDTTARRMWEAKGGLSKGKARLDLTPPTGRHSDHAWRLKTVAAGANCAIRRTVFTEIGGFCERLGPGTPVQAGETVEIVDRVLRAGYRARYTPDAWVHHNHPAQVDQLLAKLRGYARGDSALAVHIARTHGDLGAALWAFGGHQLYRLRNLALAMTGRYPLPARWAAASLLGSIEGVPRYFTRDR